MRDASALLWQAIVFLLIAISYLLISQDLALFPNLRVAAVAALLLVLLSMLMARRLLVVAAAGSTVLGAAMALAGGMLVFYDLVFVVSPARIGMLGLVLAYLVGGLLGYAAHAALAAGRILWRFRAINRYFPQVGVASPASTTDRHKAAQSEQLGATIGRPDSTAEALDGPGGEIEDGRPGEMGHPGEAERRVLAMSEV
jgi:hypothetical protein